MDMEVEQSYLDVVDKQERRFGYRDLQKTVMVTFSSARQEDNESVYQWADMVITLAGKVKGLARGFYVARLHMKISNGC
ncbi:hypothetical protein DPMN_164445 [Dreissena polymorpha]|uniref:Uncharacterized protein n=1 Tax=Dreissena polymorpha TaxID=45954 RepID=A0A9D4EV55_DREPO|nr:hypothetical protein DPMN_164445 [Dreissena polymorpha]